MHRMPRQTLWALGLGMLAFAATGILAPASAQAQSYDLPIGTTGSDPDPEPPPPPATPDEDEESAFFFDEELPAGVESVIYIVDRSSSMSLPAEPYIGLDGNVVTGATRLDYVKTELKRSVNSLSDDFTFNMLVYDECIEVWKAERVTASARRKAEAMVWIDGIEPWGWTNTGGAGARALADKPNRTILLLSDGAPNYLDCAQTMLADFGTHQSLIRQSNSQEATIHTFGIGLSAEARTFLSAVAADNGGTFREVD